MKKTLSLILALLMSVSCASFAFADDAAIAEEAVVEEATPYDEAIIFLQDNKIMQGMEDGLIHAEKDVKRYEMAIFAGRVSTGWVNNDQWMDDTANDSDFSDLKGTAAENFYGIISYAAQKGIVEGYTDGTFKPEQQVTYREALTMAVRTLGKTGLEWPWGYIEEAVKLGLTDGIEGIAYTAPLNRGQVAQIIYNTLFAKVNGNTLAMNIFGIDRAWENILVTADSRSTYTADGKTTKSGVVAFQIINANGTLDDEVYYVASDLEIGHPYRALFNVDEDAELVELVKAIECESTVTANVGLTDNEGKAYPDAYPVNTLLGKYELVSKYDLNNVLANNSYNDNEIILVDAINMGKITVVTGNEKYAFDVKTGNILKINENKEVIGIHWYYSELLDCYFEAAIEKDGSVLYKIVDEDDVKDLLNNRYYTIESEAGFTFYTKDMPGKTAYSQVEIWDVDGKAYGWYEAYRLGEYSTKSDAKCYCDEEEKGTGYVFSTLNAGNASNNNFGKTYTADEVCDDCVGYKFVEGYEPSENAKYVIYGVNEATKEIKIVKEVEKLAGDVEDLTDVDTYYANGIVRGYRMNKGTITIGEVNYAMDYSTLAGTAININMKDNNADARANREAYSEWFRSLFNQYVEYVVVDGKVVFVKPVNTSGNNYIVVENYIGVSNDGYIVVGGYSTENLSYEMFRIGAYDGWKAGDKFWYGSPMFDTDFLKGSVYKITSYDSENDAYMVENMTEFVEDQDAWGLRVDTDAPVVTVTSAAKDGYRWVGDTSYKMTDNDKYIIIPLGDPTFENVQTMPIYVYEGKLPGDWEVTGQIIAGGADKNLMIIVNADPDTLAGFDRNAYKYSMVVVLDKVITSMVYDGYGTELPYYIQGATGYEIEAFNLYTANYETVYGGYNIDIEKGRIYAAIDNVITQDVEINWFELGNHYSDLNRNSATYVIKNATYSLVKDKDAMDKYMSNVLGYSKKYDVVDDTAWYFVTIADEGFRVESIKKLDADDLAGYVEDEFFATVIYDNDSKDAIVYVYAGTASKVDVEAKDSDSATIDEIVMYPENSNEEETVALNASISYKGVKDGDTNKWLSATIEGVTIGFEDSKWTHAQLLENGCVLGINAHEFSDYIPTVDGTLCEATVTEYPDCDECAYVQSMYIKFAEAVELNADNPEVTVEVDLMYQLTIGSEKYTYYFFPDDYLYVTFTLTDSGVELSVNEDIYKAFGIDAAILEAIAGIAGLAH